MRSIISQGSALVGNQPPSYFRNSVASVRSGGRRPDQAAKTRDKIATGKEQIMQNRKMIQLDCDLELPVPIDGLRITPDYPRLIEAMEHYEFKSLLQEVRDEASRVAVPSAGRAAEGRLPRSEKSFERA